MIILIDTYDSFAWSRSLQSPPLGKGRAREGIDRATPVDPRRPANPHPALARRPPPCWGR
jgi:hypothetical protein